MTSVRYLALLPLAALAVGLSLPSEPSRAALPDPGPGASACAEARPAPLPTTFEGCATLQARVEDVAAYRTADGFRLDEYEAVLMEFFEAYCHRDAEAGWVRDKAVRDTGPWVAPLIAGAFGTPTYYGTHMPVVIWYNRSMVEWIERYRSGPSHSGDGETPAPPDGAVMVKEMYPAPAARCAAVPPENLEIPGSTGVAFMVRHEASAQDGWFWGAWWPGFTPDWPADPDGGNGLEAMGFGAYCLNCHASAREHATFADARNVRGMPGEPEVFVSQNFLFDSVVPASRAANRHLSVVDTSDDPKRNDQPLADYSPAFLARFPRADAPTAATVVAMPSQTYDHTWVPGGPVTSLSEFLTSSQCLGCHDAGSTGLQFDMTAPDPASGLLRNLSPYATWRTSPMGLGGRDPIFFAQLASETETFHPSRSELIQDVCLGCHGIQGQRQFHVDRNALGGFGDEDCDPFLRDALNAVPYPSDPAQNPHLADAPYGALGRDGIACTACHRMALTPSQVKAAQGRPENACLDRRQMLLNPKNEGFARTFTGSFFVGPPDRFLGPFEDPKRKPMDHALGMEPVHDPAIRSSEVCGSCHTVHLPVYQKASTQKNPSDPGRLLGYTYEQTTYPEWAMSAYRTGFLPGDDGARLPLPEGPGDLAQSCQGCHMRSSSPLEGRFRSKIASIQELSNFPATANTLPAEDIDLEPRTGFALHTLVGLNVFLIEMAQQFPEVLGLRTQDPMLTSHGVAPVLATERAMLAQADSETARVTVSGVRRERDRLTATVTVDNLAGHKMPSGVGFRRAFLETAVLDADGAVLWASGRTDGVGVLVDEDGNPLDGELWWREDCSARLPGTPHQPHYQRITRQDQAQIYQELVTSPAPVTDPRCGENPTPGGSFTTSFLSICGHVKDNRLLPDGFLGREERIAVARALGAGEDLAVDTGPKAVGDDPDYVSGGRDRLVYEIPLADIGGTPAYLRARLYYQATPPFYLQDRFCTSDGADTDRLYYLSGHLDLDRSRAEDWKLLVTGSGLVPLE